MDIKRSLVFVFAVCNLSPYFGQEKTIDTVYIFDNQMNKVKLFHKITTLSLSDIQKIHPIFLRFYVFSRLFILRKMVVVRFLRHHSEELQHNKPLLCGTELILIRNFWVRGDMNNIALFGYDQLEVKAGGGSVIYGSGAIGGSIHLNNDINFNKGFSGSFNSEIASFGTFNNFLKASFSNEKFSFKASGSHSISENEYEVPESRNYINRNGKYYNTNFNFAAAYKIAPFHQISWISETYDGNQHYPVFFESQTPTKYETQNFRSLVSWTGKKRSLITF